MTADKKTVALPIKGSSKGQETQEKLGERGVSGSGFKIKLGR